MAQVTLYSHGSSPYPAKVAIVLEELKIKYNLVLMESGDGPNGIKSVDYLALNPLGRIPTLVDHSNNDQVVWESTAIVLYLAEKWDASSLIGKNSGERTEILKWVMTQASDFGPKQMEHIYYKNYHPVKNLDASVYEHYVNQIHSWYSILEKQLEKGDFIVLNRLTLADIAIFPMINILELEVFNISTEKYSKLRSYVDRIRSLPAVRQAYKNFPQQPRKE